MNCRDGFNGCIDPSGLPSFPDDLREFLTVRAPIGIGVPIEYVVVPVETNALDLIGKFFLLLVFSASKRALRSPCDFVGR